MALTQESVLSFLLERGGKVKNAELLNNFGGRISSGDPAEKQHNRELFKRLVNSVAVVKQIDGVKFVCAKRRYQDFVKEPNAPRRSPPPPGEDGCPSPSTSFSCASPPRTEPDEILNSDIENNNYPANSKDKFYGGGKHVPAGRVQENRRMSEDITHADTTTVKVLNLSGDQTSVRRKSGAVFAVIAVKSPPRDSAHATQGGSHSRVHQNKTPDTSAATVNKVCASSTLNSSTCKQADPKCWKNRPAGDAQPRSLPQVRPQSKTQRQGDDAKYSESVPLEPLAHEWLVKCASGLWGQIYRLLLQDARLAQKKDFTSGFTVLHWAAKDGNHKVIRKIMDLSGKGGAYVDVNSKAHGGYTPLHIAAIHGHTEAMVLLVQSYGANVNERDNDGKKALHYVGKGAPAEVRALLGGLQHGRYREKTGDEECREHAKGFNTISKLFQPHVGKKQKTTTKFAQDW